MLLNSKQTHSTGPCISCSTPSLLLDPCPCDWDSLCLSCCLVLSLYVCGGSRLLISSADCGATCCLLPRRFVYHQDNRSHKQTPLMAASTRAWRARHDNTPETVADKPLAKSLYNWYKVLWTCLLKGEVPQRVQEVRMEAVCSCSGCGQHAACLKPPSAGAEPCVFCCATWASTCWHLQLLFSVSAC
mgnify:FL=1